MPPSTPSSFIDTWKTRLGYELSAVSFLEKLVSTVGGGLSILLLILICDRTLGLSGATGLIASMGASAVLLFGVPHGQLSQPWPVIAGHGFSALIGVACAQTIASPELAACCAVGLAIGAMHQFKCIHPPGGATALTAVCGGAAVRNLGYGFVLCPVLVNAVIMVVLAVVMNAAFPWRRYPAFLSRLARNGPRVPRRDDPSHEDIVRALQSLDSFMDVTEEDMLQLVRLLRPETETAPPPEGR